MGHLFSHSSPPGRHRRSNMRELVKELVETFGPSGHEGQIRAIVKRELAPSIGDMTTSPMGSLHAILNPGGSPRIMLAAHMDEIGVVVSHIDEKGFARFHTIGGVNRQTLLGHRVIFQGDRVGVIGTEDPDNKTSLPKSEQFFLDFGVEGREACPVQVGDMGGFQGSFQELGDRWIAKGIDDRIGVAILIRVAKELRKPAAEIQLAFTVQEEVGLRGARTSGFALDPQIAIAVDVTATGDTPKGRTMAVQLGKGPAVKVRDRGMIADGRVVRWMRETAETNDIPYQLEVLEKGTTDATGIQISRSGVPSGALSIPCRYVHTPSEMVDRTDVEGGLELLLHLLKGEIPMDLPSPPAR